MMESTHNRNSLRRQWNEIHGRLGLTPDFGEFDYILTCYKGKGRKYHGIRHLVHGFDTIQRISLARQQANETYPSGHLGSPNTEAPSIKDGALLKLAFFYHDIHYDVRRKDNEALSAAQADAYMFVLRMNEEDRMRVTDLILGTADHQGCESMDPMWPLMNDADLAILAAPDAVYKKYAKKIWQEYRVAVERPAFVAGRLNFLTMFSKKPIFRTAYMQSVNESRALANILNERMRLMAEAGV